MKILTSIAARIAALCLLASVAFAWDNPAHMAVAGLAYDALTPVQQHQLAQILAQHPGVNLVLRGFPNGAPDERSLVMAMATWPDLAKASSEYTDNGYEADQPPVTAVVFDHEMHKGWHFIDTPLWLGAGPAPQLPPVPRVNAVEVANVLLHQLHAAELDPAKAYDLAWLEHLVGDLHQPLHAVTGVTSTNPSGDVGGNAVRVSGVKGIKELHAYWDDVLGRSAPPDAITHRVRLDEDVITANAIIGRVRKLSVGPNAANLDPATWAAESYTLAKSDAYALNLQVVSTKKGDYLETKLTTQYRRHAKRDAEERVALAGQRLASLLQQILNPGTPPP